jgi:hypothetical protein
MSLRLLMSFAVGEPSLLVSLRLLISFAVDEPAAVDELMLT